MVEGEEAGTGVMPPLNDVQGKIGEMNAGMTRHAGEYIRVN